MTAAFEWTKGAQIHPKCDKPFARCVTQLYEALAYRRKLMKNPLGFEAALCVVDVTSPPWLDKAVLIGDLVALGFVEAEAGSSRE